MLRRNMEAVSFDELSKLDDSNILKHLAKDVRLSSLEQLSRTAGHSQKNGSQASGGWNYLNNRNSPAFLNHNGGSQHGAFGSQTTIGAQTPSMGSQTTISAQTPAYITALAQQRKPLQNAQPDLTKSLAQFSHRWILRSHHPIVRNAEGRSAAATARSRNLDEEDCTTTCRETLPLFRVYHSVEALANCFLFLVGSRSGKNSATVPVSSSVSREERHVGYGGEESVGEGEADASRSKSATSR